MMILFDTAAGQRMTVDAEPGQTVLTAALGANVPGMDGDCGGEMACGTCHVFVESDVATGGTRSGDENEMIEILVEDVRPESRLGCQMRLAPEMDGMVFTVAE